MLAAGRCLAACLSFLALALCRRRGAEIPQEGQQLAPALLLDVLQALGVFLQSKRKLRTKFRTNLQRRRRRRRRRSQCLQATADRSLVCLPRAYTQMDYPYLEWAAQRDSVTLYALRELQVKQVKGKLGSIYRGKERQGKAGLLGGEAREVGRLEVHKEAPRDLLNAAMQRLHVLECAR